MKSKYCKACEFWKTKTDTIEFEEWNQTHKDECQANQVGSAGKMEVNAIIEMFQRSESLHNLKYANYVGDGDSKTIKGILDFEPYKEFIAQKMCRSGWALVSTIATKVLMQRSGPWLQKHFPVANMGLILQYILLQVSITMNCPVY